MPVITIDELNGLDGDVRSAVLPIDCLAKLKDDIRKFSETEKLNGFQEWITREGYVLDVPELPFEAKSIVIITTKHRLAEMVFHFGEKCIRDLYGLDRKDLRRKIDALFTERGYHAQSIYWLPQKRLSVCAGLAEYGRNNITYCGQWGSFFEISTYLTDMPCTEPFTWREVTHAALCDRCGACVENCPTKAIRSETFLIDNTSCLTLFVESDKPYPDWVPPAAHHSIIGCYRCQEICPMDNGRMREIEATIEFDEAESVLLASGNGRSDWPVGLAEKAELLGFDEYRLKSFPKNFRALLEK